MFEIKQAVSLQGEITVPADKSVSHRTLMLGALAEGNSSVSNLLDSADVRSTRRCLESLGVEIRDDGPLIRIAGRGLKGFSEPQDVLDCGNSGTTMRLMAGLLAGQSFLSVLTGDGSLRRRPMARVITPLRAMGASITGRNDGRLAPLVIQGTGLQPIEYHLPVASAQVKSAILLAALGIEGTTVIHEKVPTRDHSERMLKSMGATIQSVPGTICLTGNSALQAAEWVVPGDISSAAFFMVAASISSRAEVLLKDVGINPTRTGILDVLHDMGADITCLNERIAGGEPMADLLVKSSPLKPVVISGSMIPRLIDEIPVLAVAMAMADGTSEVRDAEELRAKESDRIAMITRALTALGVKTEETENGFVVHGRGAIPGGAAVESGGDHRIAMAMAVAGLVAEKPVHVDDFDCVDISYPGFLSDVTRITQ